MLNSASGNYFMWEAHYVRRRSWRTRLGEALDFDELSRAAEPG